MKFWGKPMLVEAFTDDFRKALQLANQESQRFRHDYIGTEHLLIGLMRLDDPDVRKLLARCGGGNSNLCVSPTTVIAKVSSLLQFGPEVVTMGKLPQTPRAKKVIEYSMDEARDRAVAPVHLLLGLIRENEGIAAMVLKDFGFDYLQLAFANAKDGEWVRVTNADEVTFPAPIGLHPSPPQPTCETCRFFKPAEGVSVEQQRYNYGQCRRLAPQVSSGWPEVRFIDWCGEYEQSLTPPADEVVRTE